MTPIWPCRSMVSSARCMCIVFPAMTALVRSVNAEDCGPRMRLARKFDKFERNRALMDGALHGMGHFATIVRGATRGEPSKQASVCFVNLRKLGPMSPDGFEQQSASMVQLTAYCMGGGASARRPRKQCRTARQMRELTACSQNTPDHRATWPRHLPQVWIHARQKHFPFLLPTFLSLHLGDRSA